MFTVGGLHILKEKQINISVLGAGSWGTALAKVLHENGHSVLLWARSQDQVDEINKNHTNTNYLPKVNLPASIKATTDLTETVKFSSVILFVIPTKGMRETVKKLIDYIDEPKLVIHASKGLEKDSYERISEILADEIPKDKRTAIVALSGPSHAEEVVNKDITSITSASEDEEAAKYVQSLFINDYFRVYSNPDIIGVEMGAALKNIIALGSGVLSGLGYGDNANAALITRGLAEITRLGVELGARPQTFSGLSGVGDLIVTCSSQHSRNWRAGRLIGSGKSVDDTLEEVGMVVEGIFTTKAAYELAQKLDIEMPITSAIYSVIYDNQDIEKVIIQLMRREGKSEI